ncbi:hypothetical protein JGH11_00030 [Dysgonomonas sp. Marseille-P4677]|uniref:hypothetical protein n=1 Tax=Dysgonomonas sp. Marseille-P4677 TaxID=2364790 RepID=UPI0019117F08|nr:hypothetical protein [Dysgonomonas sp. Marseille-P4677]MBK5719248.1 hypothetical protein [Dysgonomonas sp. Marseille-P4677]
MSKTILSVTIISFLLCACSSEKKKDEKLAVGISALMQAGSTPVMIPSEQGIVRLSVVNGKGKTNIRKKKNQTIRLEFESKDNKSISAKIFSKDSLANIRFSQIILPNGDRDGPFGTNLNYKIYSNGIYRLLINEDMVDGSSWGGVFEVEVSLLK